MKIEQVKVPAKSVPCFKAGKELKARVIKGALKSLEQREKRQLYTAAAGEVRELTVEDLKHFKPAAEALPPTLLRKLGVRDSG